MKLHRDQSKGVCDGAEQDDHDEDRCKVLDRDSEDLLAAERMSVQFHFLFDPLDGHASCDEQADRQRRDGHHHGVGEEIEEIQERHSDDRDEGERSVAEAGERS